MAQPTLFKVSPGVTETARDARDFFEIGITRQRQQRVKKFQMGDGYQQVTPDGINNIIDVYRLTTRPLTLTEATALDEDFTDLNGDFFFAQFHFDSTQHKYRLEPNEWSWEDIGSASVSDNARTNVITFSVRRIYDYRT
tara:strand:- start:1692 stop:2108 length:417 start_codon:yes stop_codon:yes gene_type:complete